MKRTPPNERADEQCLSEAGPLSAAGNSRVAAGSPSPEEMPMPEMPMKLSNEPSPEGAIRWPSAGKEEPENKWVAQGRRERERLGGEGSGGSNNELLSGAGVRERASNSPLM